MGKYSENPIDNIQGYLNNIEMVLARMEAQQKRTPLKFRIKHERSHWKI